MTRVIRKSKIRSSQEAATLLSAIFAAELVQPGRCIWLISPWISDIPIIDNRTNDFERVRSWGARPIRLSEVLATLASCGTTVVLGTTPDASNRSFLQRIRRLFDERRLSEQLIFDIDGSRDLHEKAITGEDYVVVGSMNITNNGVFVKEEFLEFRTDAAFVARARMDAYERFGGRL